MPRIRRRIRNLHEQFRRAHPSGASGTNFEAVPGPTQCKLRAPEAILTFWQGGLPSVADCSIDGP
eukprot:15466894-Alexandrium_andersonii.AAC.1